MTDARIWRYHHPELVEFVNPGTFKEGRYPVNQILMHTEIDGMKNIRYNNSRRRNAFHIPADFF
jgi:hypothetical protein